MYVESSIQMWWKSFQSVNGYNLLIECFKLSKVRVRVHAGVCVGG